MNTLIDRISGYAGSLFSWVFSHKKIVFLYLPGALLLLLSLYVGVIYISWTSDRERVLEVLSKYKRLIDQTEELREGHIYSYSDVDVSAKVVDIPTRIYDRNNEIIGEFFEEKREIVPFIYIPRWLVQAVISSEDRNFYEHNGFSPRGMARAMLVNLFHLRVVQGGSTITQQLAKVLFTDMERSLKRKIFEIFCALEIERRYDKQDILSMYLNLIYFGNGAYGVESASKMFFGKSVRELDKTECAMIVASISNPGIYSPLSRLDNSIKKTKRILLSMVDAGFMNKGRVDSEYSRFLRRWDVSFDESGKAISSTIGSFLYSTYRINRAPFFNERIRRILVEKFGEDAVKKGGLSVFTTIDGQKQDVAERCLKRGVLSQRGYHIRRAGTFRDLKKAHDEMNKAKNIEGALVTLNPFTGEILAYVGGFEFSYANQFDAVWQMRRQPGSSFKPVIYVAAVQDNEITPSTVLVDERTVFDGGYSPRNYDNNYIGKVIVREALKRSINVVAVKVLEKTGYGTIWRILREGLSLSGSELSSRFQKTLSLALGTYEISPLENCVLQSMIVNGGDYIYPYGIRVVKDYNGNVVWDNEAEVTKLIAERREEYGNIIDPDAAAVVVSMLTGVVEKGGTAFHAVGNRSIRFHIAGKTGTSANYNDAWFVGYTSDTVTAVWVGNRAGAISLGPGRAGGVVAAPIWGEYVAGIYEGSAPPDFTLPEKGITKELICIESGLVARRDGGCGEFVREQVFREGTEPGEFCPINHGDSKAEDRGRILLEKSSNL
jgi:penicillin-binding protein 1A